MINQSIMLLQDSHDNQPQPAYFLIHNVDVLEALDLNLRFDRMHVLTLQVLLKTNFVHEVEI